MGAVLGLGVQSSFSCKDELDILGMEGESVEWFRFIWDDFGEKKLVNSSDGWYLQTKEWIFFTTSHSLV